VVFSRSFLVPAKMFFGIRTGDIQSEEKHTIQQTIPDLK
jgi:hypothetical protein